MGAFVFPAIINGLSVFGGLILLWTLLKFATLRQRVLYASVAGGFSALATFVVSALASGTL
ncbi:MAG: hypothetical protein AB7O49_18605 [Sphingomonadales bacterium]